MCEVMSQIKKNVIEISKYLILFQCKYVQIQVCIITDLQLVELWWKLTI